MTKTTKTTKTSSNVKSLYSASKLTKNSTKNLWVVYPAGDEPKNGLVFSSTLTRDNVRNAGRKELGLYFTQDVRARRVSNMSK